jgi:glycosyltransferase involved in cell wall biosynthesis
LASGLPVVTTPVGEVGRLIGELGRGGEVSPSNATALAEATFDVLDRSTEAARREAAAVAEPYRASQVLGQLYEELREMDPMSGN